MRYDAILYDFDGTLADTIPMIVKCHQAAFDEVLGIKKEEAFILNKIGLPLWDAFEGYDEETQKKLYDAYQRINERILTTEVREFPGIHEGLKAVAELGVRQGIVTSKRKESAMITVRQFDLEKYFDVFVSREDTKVHKPAPDPLFFAAEKLGITDMSRILYVGDSVHDLRCAHNAGADAAAVDWTYMPVDELKALSPRYWLHELSELSCILQGRDL